MAGNDSIGWVYVTVIILTYSLPTILAGARGHQSTGGIFLLNLLLGWTVLGWIIALVWSASAVTPTGRGRSDDFGHIEITDAPSSLPRTGERKCPHCAEIIKAEAKVCKHCGRDVAPVAPGMPNPTSKCPSCGLGNNPERSFCVGCGAPIRQ